MYIFMKNFSRQNYSYGFHISKHHNLKVIHDLYIFLMFDPSFVQYDLF